MQFAIRIDHTKICLFFTLPKAVHSLSARLLSMLTKLKIVFSLPCQKLSILHQPVCCLHWPSKNLSFINHSKSCTFFISQIVVYIDQAKNCLFFISQFTIQIRPETFLKQQIHIQIFRTMKQSYCSWFVGESHLLWLWWKVRILSKFFSLSHLIIRRKQSQDWPS